MTRLNRIGLYFMLITIELQTNPLFNFNETINMLFWVICIIGGVLLTIENKNKNR